LLDKRGVMPILSYIAIEARDGKLHLTATDLELTLSVAVDDAKIEAGGAICVPAAVFDATVKTLSGADAVFSLDEKAGRLTLTCGSYKGRLAILPFEEFPLQAKVEGTRVHLPDFDAGVAELFDRSLKNAIELSWSGTRDGSLPLPIEYGELARARNADDQAVMARYLNRLCAIDPAAAGGFPGPSMQVSQRTLEQRVHCISAQQVVARPGRAKRS
jgi:hypothetical protein